MLYQEQDGVDRFTEYGIRGLNKGEANYTAHKLEYIALKWAITTCFQEYLYGTNFTVYLDNNPLAYMLTTAKLNATCHRWVAQLATYNFMTCYRSGKSDHEDNPLLCIEWDQTIKSEDVKAILDAAIVGAATLSDVFVQNIKATVHANTNDPPPQCMATADWAEAQRHDPILGEIIRLYENKDLNTRKVDQEKPADLKQLVRLQSRLQLRLRVLYLQSDAISEDRNDVRLLLPSNYRVQVLKGSHNDIGH